ncbi:MAG TPA: hypothetical protein VNH12_07585 [Burkholderiales bacterium]|nr:hypothetical protein [Burkholderiales bacterium]
MHLVFSYVHPSKPSRTLGPFARIWLDVEGMRGDADGPVLASYREHQWSVDEEKYFRLDCTAKVRVHFTRSGDTSPPHGEFQRFSAVNGLAYGDDRVIAYLDYKKSEWLYYDTGYHWPVMVVSAVDDTATSNRVPIQTTLTASA